MSSFSRNSPEDWNLLSGRAKLQLILTPLKMSSALIFFSCDWQGMVVQLGCQGYWLRHFWKFALVTSLERQYHASSYSSWKSSLVGIRTETRTSDSRNVISPLLGLRKPLISRWSKSPCLRGQPSPLLIGFSFQSHGNILELDYPTWLLLFWNTQERLNSALKRCWKEQDTSFDQELEAHVRNRRESREFSLLSPQENAGLAVLPKVDHWTDFLEI